MNVEELKKLSEFEDKVSREFLILLFGKRGIYIHDDIHAKRLLKTLSFLPDKDISKILDNIN